MREKQLPEHPTSIETEKKPTDGEPDYKKTTHATASLKNQELYYEKGQRKYQSGGKEKTPYRTA